MDKNKMDSKYIRIRPHHIELFMSYYLDHHFARRKLKRRYGVEFTQKLKEFLDCLIEENPKVRVSVVGGLDSICTLDCSRIRDKCKKREDIISLTSPGYLMRASELKVGNTYTHREFLRRVRRAYNYIHHFS